jgi:hypothetical protein
MATGALPFVIVAAGRAMLILVTVAMRAVIVVRSFPLLGPAILTCFLSWRIVSASSIMASSLLAIIVAYEDSPHWDFKHLILWWRHVGLMAGSSVVLLVSVSWVVLVRW